MIRLPFKHVVLISPILVSGRCLVNLLAMLCPGEVMPLSSLQHVSSLCSERFSTSAEHG